MPKIRDENVQRDADFAKQILTFALADQGNSASDVLLAAARPGFPFRVVGVTAFCVAETATASVDVKIGATSVLSAAVTLDAGDLEVGTVDDSASVGGSSDEINVHVTTDGSGDTTGVTVGVIIRPEGVR